jgi:hypothetical protein
MGLGPVERVINTEVAKMICSKVGATTQFFAYE